MDLRTDKEIVKQRDWYRQMQHLTKIAPDMALKDAMGLVNGMVVESEKVRNLQDALLILAVDVCHFSPDGYLPKDAALIAEAKESPRLLMALNAASSHHAHWACGAGPGVDWALEQLDAFAAQMQSEGRLPDGVLKATR